MDRKTANELQRHMFGTYFGLRVGLAAIGIALPLVVLFTGGILHHVWLKPSISEYYYPGLRALPFLTTRDFFVGGLFAIGACLYLYKGFGSKENVALNLAGVFVCLVALLPTGEGKADRGLVPVLHMTFAVLFFLCIAYVSLFRSRDTIHLLPPDRQAGFARMYYWTGLALIVSPVAAVALSLTVKSPFIFVVETLAIWAFAAYWITKTREMRLSRAEKRALDGELEREVVAPPPGGGSDAMSRMLSAATGSAEKVVPADSSGPATQPPGAPS